MIFRIRSVSVFLAHAIALFFLQSHFQNHANAMFKQGGKSPTPIEPSRPTPSPVPGGYLEPHSHFFIKKVYTPEAILEAAESFFGQHLPEIRQNIAKKGNCFHIEYKPQEESFHLKVNVYFPDELVFHFQIFNYSEDTYAVELQRRSGDIIIFSDIYKLFRAELGAQFGNPVQPQLKSGVQEPRILESTDPEWLTPPTSKEILAAIETSAEWASSPFMEHSDRGLVQVIQLSTDPLASQLILEAKYDEFFIPILEKRADQGRKYKIWLQFLKKNLGLDPLKTGK